MSHSPTLRRALRQESQERIQTTSRHLHAIGGGARRIPVPAVQHPPPPLASIDPQPAFTTASSNATAVAPTTIKKPTNPPRTVRKTMNTNAHVPLVRTIAQPPALPKEANIEVVVRCRDRNDREVNENESPVVFCRGGREVEVKWQPPRTFHFDKVFGPGASQETLYEDVVQEYVARVLQGFSCTVFAYGQTGTGKTFTMEGDIRHTDYPMDEFMELSRNSGVIPRALKQIYDELDAGNKTYEVQMSYIEIYNEELRDLLLDPGVQAPKVRLFDDRKGGVLIEGAQNIIVKSPTEAIEILRVYGENREVAKTRSNEASSRSHAIFTVSVYITETNAQGETIVLEGKLNLVDLAGSENIGRSGAVQGRAREAGEINKSLLTLGRVINALVDKSSHVPYRYDFVKQLC